MSLLIRNPAVLVLEDGRIFHGRAYGATGQTVGEAVFTTGMTGYQETLTDPSFFGQIVVQTAPHIGNTGVNDEDDESDGYWARGYVVRDAARRSSNWRATEGLEDRLVRYGIVGISGIDTRALTRHLRDHGVMRAGIFSGPEAEVGDDAMLAAVRAADSMEGAHLIDHVTVAQSYVVPAVGEKRFTVVAYDLGMKASTPRLLAAQGADVHVVPASTPFADVQALAPDGVVFSNGPGDPAAADREVETLRQVLTAKIPFFGICFGNQLLGRALGFDTFKLAFGHRGANHPVLDVATGRVEITSQNHGFAVDVPIGEPVTAPQSEHGRVEVSHYSLNDRVVEGIRCLDVPAFSVQFHPESAAGPHDSRGLFDRFADMMADRQASANA